MSAVAIGLAGALSGALLHQTALYVDAAQPVGWRVVEGDADLGRDLGLSPAAGHWSIGGRDAWYSRASLPGRGLRSLSVELELPTDGALDLWLSRRTPDRPDVGDVLLRVHHGPPTSARMFVWDTGGPRSVTCVPELQPESGHAHVVSVEAAEGMVDLTIDGATSVCAVVGGSSPPALHAGLHALRLRALTVDGRPIPAPTPGPLPLWMLLGGVLSSLVARLERMTGAGFATTATGELTVLLAALVAWMQASLGTAAGLAWVLGPIAVAGVARLALHVGRALRPLAGTPDWTAPAALGAVVPAVGLILLGTPSSGAHPTWLAVAAASAIAAGLALTLAQRKRPLRAIALMGGLVSVATLAARVLGAVERADLAVGALAGLVLAATAGTLARHDRRTGVRGLALSVLFGGALCVGELVVFTPPQAIPEPLQPPGAPVVALPAPRDGGVLATGPLAIGRHDRGLRPAAHSLSISLGRPVHPVGDGSWGPLEVAQALSAGPTVPALSGLVVTSGTVPTARQVRRVGGPLPGLAVWIQRITAPFRPPPTSPTTQATEAIASAVRPGPVVFVTASSGPDAAPHRGVQAACSAAAERWDHVFHVDFADRAVTRPDEGWIDDRGRLTERAWAEVAATLGAPTEQP